MTNRIITGDDIVSYLPQKFTHEQKLSAIQLIERVRSAIFHGRAIAFQYDDTHRLALPASLYLQSRTPDQSNTITDPIRGYPHQRTFHTKWGRRAAGFDTFELKNSRDDQSEWWKSFHVDRVAHLALFTQQEVRDVFGTDSTYALEEWQELPENYTMNWEHWTREYMAQRLWYKTIAKSLQNHKKA